MVYYIYLINFELTAKVIILFKIMDEELQYKIAITMFNGIGPKRIDKLLDYYGNVKEFFKDKKTLPEFEFLNINSSTKEEAIKKAEKEISFCEKNKIRILLRDENYYPERLRNCPDAPHVIYCKGDTNLNSLKTLSIVGTRRATEYGRSMCEKIIGDLKKLGHDVLIISGLAYGIDISAHKAALENNLKTIGIVAHPLNTLYPPSHKNTAKEMINKGGAIISDFPTYVKTEPQNFLKRNRIIAGMSDATLVVESAKKGGALITATLANSYSRDVYAIPGKINDKYSKGCNNLIKTNMAALVESAEDIEYFSGWERPNKKSEEKIELSLFPEMTKEEEKIYNTIECNEKISINNLANISGINISKLSAILLNMEIKNIIVSLPGKRYSLKP